MKYLIPIKIKAIINYYAIRSTFIIDDISHSQAYQASHVGFLELLNPVVHGDGHEWYTSVGEGIHTIYLLM